MTTMAAGAESTARWTSIDARNLRQPAVLVFNPNAGRKLGVETNSGGADEVQAALRAEGIPFDAMPTEHAGHATELAHQAVDEGRELVIAAGGDDAPYRCTPTVSQSVSPLHTSRSLARHCVSSSVHRRPPASAPGRLWGQWIARERHTAIQLRFRSREQRPGGPNLAPRLVDGRLRLHREKHRTRVARGWQAWHHATRRHGGTRRGPQ